MPDSWTKRSDGSTVWSERGGNVNSPVSWTTATRPSSPFNGQTGLNTDFNGLETYNSTSSKWRILSGTWTFATRPDTTDIDVGSRGYNSNMEKSEEYNGTDWIS
jgi:hypothetical protein